MIHSLLLEAQSPSQVMYLVGGALLLIGILLGVQSLIRRYKHRQQ